MYPVENANKPFFLAGAEIFGEAGPCRPGFHAASSDGTACDDSGTAGYICREHCFANNLVMRHVGDRMIISPPLIITPEEIKIFAERATKALDATYADLKDKDMLKAAS